MYLEHFNLNEKPFESTSDPKFIWLSKDNVMALKTFRQSFMNDEGCLILSGDIGSGKNAWMKYFLRLIRNKALSSVIWDPDVETLDLLNLIALEFRINRQFNSKADFLYYFKSLAENAYLNNLKLLIVIDEAQRLKPKIAYELNLLMNINIKDTKPINTLLLIRGKEQKSLFKKTLGNYNFRNISHHHLEPLSHEDTFALIKHRLKVSGSDKLIFTEEAMHEIYTFSAGNPRLTNLICDRSLLTGYAAGLNMIGESIVSECAKELKIFKSAA